MNGESKPLILVVDDTESRRYAKVRILRQAGFMVAEASTGQECLAAVQKQTPWLVVLDIGLPDADGRDICRRIKENPESARIAVLQFSATFVNQDDTALALDQGADASLTEPLQPMVFLATVRALLRSRQAEDALREAFEQQRMAREIAESANRAKDEFLAVLSHELRSPLNAILTWATLLRGGDVDEERTAMGLEAIERNARLQNRLIDDLLDVSRIVSGKLTLSTSEVPIALVLESSLESARGFADNKDIVLESFLPEDLGPVAGDAARLEQIFQNLISNAMKFTPQGGRVEVRAESHPAWIRVDVIDNGMGITPELLPHIFERFRQGDSTRTRSEGGLGLGLAIVRHLSELHGGTVEAASDGLGKGSRFSVQLPRVRLGSESPLPRHSRGMASIHLAPRRLDGLRVLLVDDDADARGAIAAILEDVGADVRAAGGVSQAMESLDGWEPHAVVTDLGMPGEDGYSLLTRVREREDRPKIALIALTAYASTSEQQRALAVGFDAFLTKPVEPTAMITVIGELARGAESGGAESGGAESGGTESGGATVGDPAASR